MKKLRNFFLTLFLMILIMDISRYPGNANILSKQKSMTLQADHSIVPLKDVIIWRYKTLNGKTYKRLYNSTTRQWIGNWILVD